MQGEIFIGIDPAFRKKGKGVCICNGANVCFLKLPSVVDLLDIIYKLAEGRTVTDWPEIDTSKKNHLGC